VELIDEEEISAASAVLRSKQLFRFGHGEECATFEHDVQERLGVKHALFLNSGTSALTCGLAGLGIGPGDEVIIPAYTYIATAAAVVDVGAVPVIAEIDESLGLDPADVAARITPSTKAILPVHMQGVPCRLAEVAALARSKGLFLLEDCCQAVGASYRGRPVGTHGDAGAWSLNYFKAITCGEGGVFFTDDDDLFERALFQHDPALPMWLKDRPTWRNPPFSRGGYRGNELTAAVARVQLRKLPRVQEHCRGLKRLLLSLLPPKPRCFRQQHVDDPVGDNGTSFAMIALTKDLADRMSMALTAEGLPIGGAYQTGFPDRHLAMFWDSIVNRNGATAAGYPWKDPAYRGTVAYARDAWPRTMDILSRSLRLPIHMHLTEAHIRQVADAINKVDAALA
jgi:dTDP-4-amino-4,6-dideoxygalactose transaminase